MPAKTDPTTAYARAVVAGKIVAGHLVRLACQRHLDDLKAQKKKRLSWSPEHAQHAIGFFRDALLLSDGRPFVLEPFQEFIVGSLFGWFNVAGNRRFRTAYVEMGKGGGKSPTAAGIGLYLLICDGQDEPEAEVYSAAVSREQALIVFRDAKSMVETSPELGQLVEVNAGSLIVHSTRSVFRPVSSEHRGLDGKRVHGALVDELHEHPHALVVDKMRAGTKTRRNAIIFEITNSGYDRTSVCWDHHEYSIKVLEGSVANEAWFAYVCALDEGDEWTDEKVWPKANPGIDAILPREYLREQVQEAVGMPSKENIVKRLNFCVWTEQADRWIQMPLWAKARPRRKLSDLRGKECFAGLDLSSTSDITAFVLLFPDEDEEDMFDLFPFFWVPQSQLEVDTSTHKERVRLDLLAWAKATPAYITATPGNVVDYGFVEKKILESADLYDVQEIGYDRWNATQTVTRLTDEGAPLMPFGQGFASMSAPAKQFERLVKLGGIRHGDDPVMRWMVSNVSIRQDPAGNIKPDKETSGEKIDGPVAGIMALGLWMARQREAVAGPSIYADAEKRPDGLLTI